MYSRLSLAGLILLLGLFGVVQAERLPADTVVASWERAVDPLRNRNIDIWTVEDDTIRYPGTQGSSLLSDFTVDGDFSYTTRLVSRFTSNGRFGVFFGYSDNEHHYRFSWNGVSNVPSLLVPEQDGTVGINLVRKNGFGVSSAVSLFHDDSLSLRWLQGIDYDVTVSRSADAIGLLVERVSDGAVFADFSVVDTTFTSGQIGLWTTQVNTNYDVANVTYVPEPSGLTLLGMAVLLGCCGRRWRKQMEGAHWLW